MEAKYPFHPELWPKWISRPEQREPGPLLSLGWENDLSEREKKETVYAWIEALPTLRGVTGIKVWAHVTQPVFDALCEVPALERLQIKWSNVQKLTAISRSPQLTHLYIGSSTRVESIEPLRSLRSLEFLEIENFKRIKDFSPLADMRSLRDLSVTGSMWSRQDVGSLQPFASMTWLDSLCVDTSHLKSIRALAALRDLKFLGIGGRLPWDEYAWLAGRLPNTECQWFAPFLDLSSSGLLPCNNCKRKSMVMLTGKGMPVICRFCDQEKLQKHSERFESVRAASAAEFAA